MKKLFNRHEYKCDRCGAESVLQILKDPVLEQPPEDDPTRQWSVVMLNSANRAVTTMGIATHTTTVDSYQERRVDLCATCTEALGAFLVKS